MFSLQSIKYIKYKNKLSILIEKVKYCWDFAKVKTIKKKIKQHTAQAYSPWNKWINLNRCIQPLGLNYSKILRKKQNNYKHLARKLLFMKWPLLTLDFHYNPNE